MRQLSDTERVTLARDVFEAIYSRTESFEVGNVGANLAYLLGAITSRSDEAFELSDDPSPEEQDFTRMLKNSFPSDHAIWQFITSNDDAGTRPTKI